jgi:hypothetical protein
VRLLTNALVAAVGLALLAFLLLVSVPGLLGGGASASAPSASAATPAGSGPEPVRAAAADEAPAARELRCPPCGMSLPADTELVEIAGRRWAVCSERCAELIAADPEAFAADAVGAQ